MGDHMALLVDRLITESTIQAALESRSRLQSPSPSTTRVETVCSSPKSKNENETTSGKLGKLVECRICQDDDLDSNMESPCACCGSLKYAHRTCIQKWCNEKGNITCEICHQQFKPGFTAPQQLFHYGSIPMNFRGNWEISRRDLNNSQFVAMVATERNFMDPDYDGYSCHNARGFTCFRCIAAVFMILLILRHTFPLILMGYDDEYSFTVFMTMILRAAGVLIPIYIMARILATFQRRRHQQVHREFPIASEQSLC